MSLLTKILDNRPTEIPETKGERMEMVLENLMSSLPLPVRILAGNFMESSLPYNDENADKIIKMLNELADYIDIGLIPNEERNAENT